MHYAMNTLLENYEEVCLADKEYELTFTDEGESYAKSSSISLINYIPRATLLIRCKNLIQAIALYEETSSALETTSTTVISSGDDRTRFKLSEQEYNLLKLLRNFVSHTTYPPCHFTPFDSSSGRAKQRFADLQITIDSMKGYANLWADKNSNYINLVLESYGNEINVSDFLDKILLLLHSCHTKLLSQL